MAQPVVNAIENNYSYIPAGLPGYGIAQGSIFAIFGANFVQKASGLQGVPLKTVLDGVSVQFSVQGATTQALLYYVSPTQITGILPSATPVGTGTVTVTSGGQSGSPAPLTVVQSAIGIAGGIGAALALAVDGSHELLPSFSNFSGGYAANPGETITFYGTGAGPVPGDESIQQTPQDLSNVPLEIDIGGISATVTYHGRSIYPGLDQFNVVVPQGPVGCRVSVIARSGDYVSNSSVIPVASSGRVCSDPDFGTTVDLTSTGKPLVMGTLLLEATQIIQNSSTGLLSSTTAYGGGGFQQVSLPAGATAQLGGGAPIPTLGGCVVFDLSFPTTPPPPPPLPSPPPPATFLDAGPFLNYTGPNGVSSLWPVDASSHTFTGPLSLITGQAVIPQGGGSFTIDNGSGGKDIGGFKKQLTFPPLLTLSNASTLFPAIDRSKPLTLQWTGGDPTGFLLIGGQANLPPANNQQLLTIFQCSAPVSAGQFTIPAAVLMALPAQARLPGQTGAPVIYLESRSGGLTFTAPGADAGVVNLFSSVDVPVGFQ